MNYKSLVIIALALCLCVVPALAAPVWSAGNYVTDGRYDNCDSVKYNPQTDVYSCYRDNNPANEIKSSENGNGGWAEGSIRAGYSTLSNTIYVRNVLQDANVSPMVISVNPDATFRIPGPDDGVLAPGDYDATLDNFNLPDETVRFTIAANQQEPTRISFNGQAASAPSTYRTLEIVKAQYGEIKKVCYNDVTEYRFREIKYEFVCDKYWPNGICKQGHMTIKYPWSEWSTEKPCGYYEYHGEPGVGFDKRIIDGQCATTGAIIDVTGIVQGLVSNGHLNIISDYPNQHYNSLFTDPAPGIFKHLSVDYKINGGVLMHKTVAEDEDLNL